ncbi:MAG: DedA family protein [Candidatus Gracilibacteria bacterium]|jgi:membrane protein DedA with SNARE-associated domain
MKSFKNFLKITTLVLHVIFLIAMIGIGILSFTSPETIRTILDWMGEQIRSWGNWNYLILFLVAMIESFPFIGVVVPGMNVMILVGGFFVQRDMNIFLLSAVLAMLGACLGNALGYMMGRISGKELLQKYGLWIGLGPKELGFLERQVHKNGFWFIIGGKFHNLLRSFVPYLAASQGLSGRKFWVANIVGSSIWAVCILLIGIFFVESYEVVLQYLSYILIVVIVGVFAVYSYKQKKKL